MSNRQIVSDRSMRLIESRDDVLDMVYEVADIFKPMIPSNEASKNLFRAVAEKKVHELLGLKNPPNGYFRYAFERFTVSAALEIDTARREIEWSEPIDWRTNA